MRYLLIPVLFVAVVGCRTGDHVTLQMRYDKLSAAYAIQSVELVDVKATLRDALEREMKDLRKQEGENLAELREGVETADKAMSEFQQAVEDGRNLFQE